MSFEYCIDWMQGVIQVLQKGTLNIDQRHVNISILQSEKLGFAKKLYDG